MPDSWDDHCRSPISKSSWIFEEGARKRLYKNQTPKNSRGETRVAARNSRGRRVRIPAAAICIHPPTHLSKPSRQQTAGCTAGWDIAESAGVIDREPFSFHHPPRRSCARQYAGSAARREAEPARAARAAAAGAQLLRSVLPGWRISLDLLSASLSLFDRRRCSTNCLAAPDSVAPHRGGPAANEQLWSSGVASSLSGLSALSGVPRRRRCPISTSTPSSAWRPCTPAALPPPSARPSVCSRPCSVSDPTRASRFRPPRPNWSSTPRTVSQLFIFFFPYIRAARCLFLYSLSDKWIKWDFSFRCSFEGIFKGHINIIVFIAQIKEPLYKTSFLNI